jgi:hypothetical protein
MSISIWLLEVGEADWRPHLQHGSLGWFSVAREKHAIFDEIDHLRFGGINGRCLQRDPIEEFAYKSTKFLVNNSRILEEGCVLSSCVPHGSFRLRSIFGRGIGHRLKPSLRTPILSVCGTQRCKKKRVALSYFHPNVGGSIVRSPLNEHAPPLGGFAGLGYVSIRLLPTCLFSPGTARMHSIVSLEIVKHEKLA